MKQKINIFLIAAVLVFMQFSCTDDLLEPKPLSFYVPGNVYTDASGFEAALVTLRKELTFAVTGSKRYNMVCEWAASEAGVPTFQLDWNQTTPNSDMYYQFLNHLTDSYEFIKNANVIIGRIDDIEWDNDQAKKEILAEAYWHRSYWYYWLINAYGDVPFVSEEIKDAKLDYQTHSRWAILNKIQVDMEFAVQFLPDNAIPGAITKAAGNHLLTKIYLANLEFDKAIGTASEIINGKYALMTERFGSTKEELDKNIFWDLHRPENKNISENTEVILAIIDRFEAPTEAKSVGLYTMRHYNCGWYNGSIKDSQGAQGTVTSGSMYDTLGRGNPDLALTTYGTYEIWNNYGYNWQNTSDLRRSDLNWIDKHEILYNNPNSVDFGKPLNVNYMVPSADTVFTFFPMIHYKVYVPQEDPIARPMGGNGDWYIYRLAETYLLRAEAYYWKGQNALAAIDLNIIRERANAVLISAGDVDLNFIFDERARELFLESTRHSELVRVSYILAKSNLMGYSLDHFSEKNWWYDRVINHNSFYTVKPTIIGNTASINPFNVLWPISSEVITANTLGRINQNIGYVGAELNVPPLETIE